MSIPDFERAEYAEPRTVEGQIISPQNQSSYGRNSGQVLNVPLTEDRSGAFPKALIFGAMAAVVGSIGYALFSLTGWMISIVAIGVAWLIAKAMMTASGGVGGRAYQIAAVVMTYFAVSAGEILGPLWQAHQRGAPLSLFWSPKVLSLVIAGPFLDLQGGFNGIMGILILGIGLRAAWRMAAGGPGFGQGGGGRRITPFG